MDIILWLAAIIFAFFLWWFGFIATKQMRIDKNRERTVKWEAIAARQKAEREAAAQLVVSDSASAQLPPNQQSSTKAQDLEHSKQV